MKKKAALLLALIMVLSMIPMNVFGAGLITVTFPRPAEGDGSGDYRQVVAQLDLAQLRGGNQFDTANPTTWLRITLDNANDQWNYAALGGTPGGEGATPGATRAPSVNVLAGTAWVNTIAGTSGGASNFQVVTPAAVAIQNQAGGPHHERITSILVGIQFDSEFNGGPFSATGMSLSVGGALNLGIDMIITRGAMPRLIIEVINPITGEVLHTVVNQDVLEGGRARPGVAFSLSGEPRAFQSGLILPRIDMVERIPGSFALSSGARTLRLVAPYDYAWNVGIPGVFGSSVTISSRNDAYSGSATGIAYTVGPVSTTDRRQALDITFTLPTRAAAGTAAFALNGVLGIEGLGLIPMIHAPESGDVNIDISWLPRVSPWGAAENVLANAFAGGDWQPLWRTTNFQVGVRTDVSLELTTTAVPNIVSGITGPAGFPAVGHTSGDHATRAARIQVRELAAGALNTNFNDSILDLHLGEGVEIVHAAWRIVNGGIGWTALPRPEIALLPNQIPNLFPGISAQGVAQFTEDGMRIFLPRLQAPTQLRTLEVYLYLSVEAGFVSKYDASEISVTVSGNAVAALANDAREAIIANVIDPVSVSLDGDMLRVETGRTHNLMERTPIGDIVISEDTHGRLRTNDVVWVYVVGTHIQRPSTLAFSTNLTPVIDSGDIRVSPTRILRRQLPNGLWVEGVEFTVTRASTNGNASTIRLTGNHLFGEILPGQDYMAVVSGPRVAANELQVAGTPGVTPQGALTIDLMHPNPWYGMPGTGAQTIWTVSDPVDITIAMLLDIATGARLTALQDALIAGTAATSVADLTSAFLTGLNIGDTGSGAGSIREALDAVLGHAGYWEGDPGSDEGRTPPSDNWASGIAAGVVGQGWAPLTPRTTTTVAYTEVTVPEDANITDQFIIVTQTLTPSVAGQNVINAQTPGIFDTLPYALQVVEWTGFDYDVAPPAGPGPGFAAGNRASFTTDMMVNVDGVEIQAIHFEEVAGARVTKMSGRVFADFIGGTTEWNPATNTATFTGVTAMGDPMVVALTTNNPVAVVNGVNVDIATGAMQPQFAGQINPVIVDGRQYVPARFLANMFGVPIDFTGTGPNMTIILG